MNRTEHSPGYKLNMNKKLINKQKKRKLVFYRKLSIMITLLIIVLFMFLAKHSSANEVTTEHIKMDSSSVSKHMANRETDLIQKEVPTSKVVVTQTTVTKKKVLKKKIISKSQAKPSIYNAHIPMPKEHQEYLYELCKKRGLNYTKTLAVIKHESNFDANATNPTKDYGYFQVNLVNHKELASKLHTGNSPLNPYINMNWGTYMLSDLYQYWGDKGYSGQGLEDAVWSSYNKGINGFLENGHAIQYISKMKQAIVDINQVM